MQQYIYSESHKKEVISKGINGIVNFIKCLNQCLFNKNIDSFNSNHFKNYLPYYVINIFQFREWLYIQYDNNTNKLYKNISNYFKSINLKKYIKILLNYLKKHATYLLKQLSLSKIDDIFNQLIIFALHIIIEYNTNKNKYISILYGYLIIIINIFDIIILFY